MEICKNKKTGSIFVYLDEQEDGRALMISPQGDVKALEYHLFTEPTEVDEDAKDLLLQGQLTDKQFDIYIQYVH
jgi:hypothetical protein